MNETAPKSTRPGRFQVPTLLGGLVIGALIMGAIAPLVGTERDETVGAGSPDFLDDGSFEPTAGDGPSSTTSAGTSADSSSSSASSSSGIGSRSSGGGGSQGIGGSATGADGDAGARVGNGGGGAREGSAAEGGGSTDVARTASDVGITEDTIRVGMMALNCKGCAAFGISLESDLAHEDIAAVFVDDINASGGIHGRTIELFSAEYDPVEDAVNGGGTERAGCIELTERRKVFGVVMGGANYNSCFYVEHETPVLTHSDYAARDPEDFNRGEGRIWTLQASLGRRLVDFAEQIDRQGLLTKATKWGVVVDEPQEQDVAARLLAALEAKGYTPTHTSVLPQNPAQTTTKVAQEVPAMQAKGVTHVLMMSNFSSGSTFAREAKRNGFKPRYVVSDYPNGANDFTGGQFHRAGDWIGTVAVSSTPEGGPNNPRTHPVAKPCIDRVEQATGRRPSNADLSWIYDMCTTFKLFERAMTEAGPNPTRRSYVQALAQTGSFPMYTLGDQGTFGGRYSFGPVKWSAVSFGQRKVWTSPCPFEGDEDNACYVTEGPVYRMAG